MRTVQEEIARERKYWKQNQVWALVLAAVVLLNLLGGSGFSVAPGPDALTLTMHDGTICEILYSTITETQLLDVPQYGTMIEGEQSRRGASGTWEHPEWGRYTLCVYSSGSYGLRILADGQYYLVNLSSPVETQQLYQIIQDKMPDSR